MKTFKMILVASAIMVFAACGSNESKEVEMIDSTVVDSTVIDTIESAVVVVADTTVAEAK